MVEMRFKNFDEFGQAVRDLELEYEKHFDTKFPERIIGWWDPLNLTFEEANEGIWGGKAWCVRGYWDEY